MTEVNEQSWEVPLQKVGSKSRSMTLLIPASIGGPLTEMGYNRAILTVTKDGLLYKPYRGEKPEKRARDSVQLPDWQE